MRDFYGASMFDFQALRGAYLIKNGIDEEEEQIESTEDLDDLYADLAKHINKE